MIGIPIVKDASKLIAEPAASLDGPATPLPPEQIETNIYAAYWQARSGFFTPAPKSGGASPEAVRGSRP